MGCCSDSSSPSSNTTIDKEIDACLSTLRALQYSLKASSHDRRRGGNANNNNDSFAGMKSVIIQRLTTVRNLMDAAPQMGAGGESDLNTDSKAIVSHQAAIRENVRLLNEEFRKLESIYKSESRRRRKNYSREEADNRRIMFEQLGREIEEVKYEQRKAYAKNYERRNVVAMEDSVIFGGGNGEMSVGRGGDDEFVTSTDFFKKDDLTSEQNQHLLAMEQRDVEFDRTIYTIGQGVEDLHMLAVSQNEEVKLQNIMLEDMTDRLNSVRTKMDTVNSRLKTVLKEVSRPSDKLCVDVVCIVLTFGLAYLFYREGILGDLVNDFTPNSTSVV